MMPSGMVSRSAQSGSATRGKEYLVVRTPTASTWGDFCIWCESSSMARSIPPK